MNPQTFGPSTAIRAYPSPSSHNLTIRQHPDRAKVVVRGKEKDRKPIDPPPVIQLRVNDPYNDICSYLHNPYYFCTVALWEEEANRAQANPDRSNTRLKDSELLVGALVSSLHRLKDLDNSEQGFFVFGDLSVAILGKFRLRFSLWELHPDTNDVHYLREILSAPFEVTAAKDWDGVRESTPLSRTLADQGVRLRLRKESRHSGKRTYNPSTGGTLVPQTPIRPGPSHPSSYDTLGSHEGSQQGSQQGYHPPSSNGWGQPQSMYSTVSGQPGPYGSYSSGGYPYGPMAGTSYYQQPMYGTSYGYAPPQGRGDPRSFSPSYAPQMASQAPQQSPYDYGRNPPNAPPGGRGESGYYESGYGQIPNRYGASTPYGQHQQQAPPLSQPQLSSSQYSSRDSPSSSDARLAPIRRHGGSDYQNPGGGMEDAS